MHTLSWCSLATAQHSAVKCYYSVAAVLLIILKYKQDNADDNDDGHRISTHSFFPYYELTSLDKIFLRILFAKIFLNELNSMTQ